MENWASKFESIGDNCEFGFVQRLAGIDEGSLLKWCRILDHQHLVKLLTTPADRFYRFNNLVPKYDSMVEDTSSGMLFHTVLYSHEENGFRVFNADRAQQDKIYRDEYEKRMHLYRKFIDLLTKGGKVLVFKQNGVDDINRGFEIADALRRHGSKFKLL